jgi:hypothetical protein
MVVRSPSTNSSSCGFLSVKAGWKIPSHPHGFLSVKGKQDVKIPFHPDPIYHFIPTVFIFSVEIQKQKQDMLLKTGSKTVQTSSHPNSKNPVSSRDIPIWSSFGQPFVPLAAVGVFGYIYRHLFGETKACSPLPCAVG